MSSSFFLNFYSIKEYTRAIIIVNSHNLYSSVLDGIHLITLFNDILKIKYIHVLTDCLKIINEIVSKTTNYNNIIIEYVSNGFINTFANIIKKHDQDNLLIALSSHGYANGDNNYINFEGQIIKDIDFHKVLVNNINPTIKCLIFVDTCQSGTMFNLNYKTKDLINYTVENNSGCNLDIICISAVDDNEFDQDDISELGYDGGLTSALIDFLYENNDISVENFFKYYLKRICPTNKHPVLSFNLLKIN